MQYSDIPKDIHGNLSCRKEVLLAAAGDRALQRELIEACREDVRFYVNLFVWTIDPRRRDLRKLPFITYGFQDDGLLALNESCGREPMGIEKSRGVGWTWTVIPFFDWRIRFFEWEVFGMMSRKEDLVDSSSGTNNIKTLFGKFDFVRWCLPSWMRPKGKEVRTFSPPTYVNPDTNSSLHGESLTLDSWRQDRLTMILIDEHAFYRSTISGKLTASVSGATDSPVFLSTHQGRGTEFYRQVRGPDRCRVLQTGWWSHPEHSRGLYYVDREGGIDLKDRSFWDVATVRDLRQRYSRVCRGRIKPSISNNAPAREHYPFNRVGPNTDEWEKLRSPYYDEKCAELGNRKLICQELDIDPIGSGDDYFDAIEIEKLLDGCRDPELRGTLSVDPLTGVPEGFLEAHSGLFKLWFSMAAEGGPPVDRYVIGADVSAGTAATPSCMTVGSLSRGVVATFAGNKVSPTSFGTLLFGAATWFHRARIIYEGQGPGEVVTHRLKELGYGNVVREKSGKWGIWATPDSRQSWLELYAMALGNGDFINPDRESISECNDFEWKNGRIVHRGEVVTDDEGAKGKQHGDRVTSAALCWYELRNRFKSYEAYEAKTDLLPGRVPKYSQAWWEQQAMAEFRPAGAARGRTYQHALRRGFDREFSGF